MTSIDSAIAGVIDAQKSAVSSQIATTVAAKTLDAAEQQGQAAVALIESAARLNKQAGVGAAFDAQG